MTTIAPQSVEQRLDEMAEQIRFLAEDARERQEIRQSITDLTGDLTPIAHQSMRMMQFTFRNVQDQGETDRPPPGLFALLGQMRDPEVRRGLNRLMSVLRSMGQISEDNNREEARQ